MLCCKGKHYWNLKRKRKKKNPPKHSKSKTEHQAVPQYSSVWALDVRHGIELRIRNKGVAYIAQFVTMWISLYFAYITLGNKNCMVTFAHLSSLCKSSQARQLQSLVLLPQPHIPALLVPAAAFWESGSGWGYQGRQTGGAWSVLDNLCYMWWCKKENEQWLRSKEAGLELHSPGSQF